MHRRGLAAIEVLIFLAVTMAIILLIVPFLERGAEAAQSDLDNLRSCGGGLVGSLGGGKGVCVQSAQCASLPAQEGFHWFYAGEGWSCPKAEELTQEQKNNGEGPYCCIQVADNRNDPSVWEISRVKADSAEGKITLVKGEGSRQAFLSPDNQNAKVARDEDIRVHYSPAQGDGEMCQYSITLSFADGQASPMEFAQRDNKCDAIINFGTALELLDRQAAGHALLDKGGKVAITVTGSGTHSAEFPVTATASQGVEGVEGPAQSRIEVMRGTQAIAPSDAKVAQDEAITLRYTPAQGEQQCTYTFVIGAGGSQLVRKENVAMRCTAQGTISLGTPLQILAQHNIQASSIDGGATFTIAVRGNEERVATFPICPKSGCA